MLLQQRIFTFVSIIEKMSRSLIKNQIKMRHIVKNYEKSYLRCRKTTTILPK
jgi:hypothetical protein